MSHCIGNGFLSIFHLMSATLQRNQTSVDLVNTLFSLSLQFQKSLEIYEIYLLHRSRRVKVTQDNRVMCYFYQGFYLMENTNLILLVIQPRFWVLGHHHFQVTFLTWYVSVTLFDP